MVISITGHTVIHYINTILGGGTIKNLKSEEIINLYPIFSCILSYFITISLKN